MFQFDITAYFRHKTFTGKLHIFRFFFHVKPFLHKVYLKSSSRVGFIWRLRSEFIRVAHHHSDGLRCAPPILPRCPATPKTTKLLPQIARKSQKSGARNRYHGAGTATHRTARMWPANNAM
jgi:hypothetical protein